jgi:hypothetical protein
MSKFLLITVKRNPDELPETILYSGTSVIRFMEVEIDCGRNPVILWSQEITKDEYEEGKYYFDTMNKRINKDKRDQ